LSVPEWNYIEFRRNQRKYQQQYRKDVKELIFYLICIYGLRGGISRRRLAEIVELNEKNLLKYLKELTSEGKIKKANKLAHYFPTDEFYKDPLLNAYIFGENISRRFLRRPVSNLPNKELRTEESDELKKLLSAISNTIGGFIVRLLIEAINEENYSETMKSLSRKDHHVLVQKYVEKGMSPVIPRLVPAFHNMITNIPEFINEFYKSKISHVYIWSCLQCSSYAETYDKNNIEKHEKNHYEKTGHTKSRKTEAPIPIESKERKEKGINMFLLKREIIEQLVRTFNSIYPILGIEFDKVLKNMPNERNAFKKITESLYQKIEQQKSCKHEFKPPFKGLYGYYEKYGSRCEKRIRVKPNKESRDN
jgi:predicted transcriptional regulator